MAATGYTPSILFNSVTTGNTPSSLVQGETAWNITDKKLWVGNASGTPIQLIGTGANVSFTDLAYAGTLTGGTGVVNLGSGQFYKDASGNVGIGTSSPTVKLQVAGGAAIQGANFPSSGAGIELSYNSGTGLASAQAYDRTGSAWKDFEINALTQRFGTSGSERMRIDSSGNVLIGQTSTGFGKLVVNAGSSNSAEFKTANATCLINFTPTGYNRFTLGVGQVNVNDFGISDATAGVTKFLITSSGNAVLQGGNTTANGVGVAFPATQSASSDANTLDDYEEGTWTPTCTTTGITSVTTGGKYTKIGNMVYLVGFVSITNAGTASGQMAVSNLPFSYYTSGGSIQGTGVCRESGATGLEYYFNTQGNATTFFINSATNGAVIWINGYTYTFSMTYQTAT